MTNAVQGRSVITAVDVTHWARDEDHAVHPYGTKAKRTLICPQDAANPPLIPGHRYLFKVANDWRKQQLWSEVISHHLGIERDLNVPACFPAFDRTSGESGALIEFFYGYPGETIVERLVHGADLLQGAGLMCGSGVPHGVAINAAFCRESRIHLPEEWWARVIAFDTLIGNVDRHSQNWGFLVGATNQPTMAPVFDNGTSLGYEIRDDQIAGALDPMALSAYVAKGHHSMGWDEAEPGRARHAELCARFAMAYPHTREIMVDIANLDLEGAAAVLAVCSAIPVEPRFSPRRAELVFRLLGLRRELLLSALGA
jgi:hypothetical protein